MTQRRTNAMQQKAQTNLLLIGIGAIIVATVGGYFGLDYLSGKKPPIAKAAATAQPGTEGDYSAAIAAATENVAASGGAGLTAEEARRIGEEVARQVAAQVAQSIVDRSMGGGTATGGLTEAEARRIGEEEGRRVAQEVATATIQQALAASGGGSGSAGLSAAEAEQIGIAAGRRAAQQVAASTARDVVRNEFGGSVVAKSDSSPAPEAASAETTGSEVASAPTDTAAAPSQRPAAGADALRAWWTAPSGGDFGLLYAGQPKGEPAIALLFSGQPSDTALNQSIKVYDAKGFLVSGSWEAAANPRLAVLRGLRPGRYTVVVEPALADASGKAVNKGQHGPVYVI